MKDKIKKYYMSIAELTADLSYAQRLKVGAIAVKDHRIISIGYNGTPAKVYPNVCENDKNETLPEVLHAESNMLGKLCKSNESSEGSIVFVTHSPCLQCSKIMYNAGISKVYYKHDYRLNDGLEFLKTVGVEVEKIV